ncbi:M48 family metallopeptidase [bacterium]|nr:M48 family metallopeptidase [bacterium]
MAISISVVRSPKRLFSTTMRIINRGEIELRAPQRINIETLFDFVAKNTKFLAKSLSIPQQAILPKTLATGTDLFLFGKRYLLEIIPAQKQNIVVNHNDKVVAMAKRGKSISRHSIYDLLTNELSSYIITRTTQLAPQMSLIPFGKIRFKLVRSLWGSCTKTGSLTFNKRLIHYPKGVIDYVIIHELAHLQQHNHSKAFWDIVEKHCPEHKQARLALKKRIYG